LLGKWWLFVAWFAWWICGVNWKKTWPVLEKGGWAVVVLAMVTVALVWSQMAPSSCDCLGFTVVENFWWQLGAVSLFTILTLFCGWLQDLLGWAPAEISLDPPEASLSNDGHHH
jgi:hypothetical protein